MEKFLNLLKSTKVPQEFKSLNIAKVQKMREELRNNLLKWKELFESLSVVVQVNTYEDDVPGLLEIDISNSVKAFLLLSDGDHTTFQFRDNPYVEPVYDHLYVFVNRDYDSGDPDDIFDQWCRKAFPGSKPKLTLIDFYSQLLVLEKVYKETVPEPIK
ncbi:hypothetical protein COB64_00585 [Candidatus Wolfebacteria bacterium]|nr:MAG: hypothetical protein COB64_00585 [Candidatus Wolfebacteria bacterium]